MHKNQTLETDRRNGHRWSSQQRDQLRGAASHGIRNALVDARDALEAFYSPSCTPPFFPSRGLHEKESKDSNAPLNPFEIVFRRGAPNECPDGVAVREEVEDGEEGIHCSDCRSAEGLCCLRDSIFIL